MATHSSVLAWRIPGTPEPGGLPSMGSHRVGHNYSDLAVASAADSSKGGLEQQEGRELGECRELSHSFCLGRGPCAQSPAGDLPAATGLPLQAAPSQ